MLAIEYAACSERGARRFNEDQVSTGRSGGLAYAVLADGAGGHSRGAEAAQRAVRQVEAALERADRLDPRTLTRAVRNAHAELRRLQPPDPRQRLHTTIVALWLDGDAHRAIWTHVGDSRLYRLRHGAVDLVTRDDSVVQRLLDAKVLTPQQARNHPYRNDLVAALGIDGDVEPHTSGEAVEIEDGDAFLLCSDGWWGALDEAVIQSTLNDSDSPEQWLAAMSAFIQHRAGERQDNFSAVVLWIGDPTESTRIMSEEDDSDSKHTSTSSRLP